MHVLWVWPGLGGRGLEKQAAHFLLFLNKDLKVLVDDGHRQQDTCTTANGTWRERERERERERGEREREVEREREREREREIIS